MKPLTKSERRELLGHLFWDLNVDPKRIEQLLQGQIEDTETISKADVYYRLLTSYSWYHLLKLVPQGQLEEMLDDTVISKLKPKSLAQKYIYARQFLRR